MTIIALPTVFASRVHLQFSRHYGDTYLTGCQAFRPEKQEKQGNQGKGVSHAYILHGTSNTYVCVMDLGKNECVFTQKI